KVLIVITALIVGSIITVKTVLANGSLQRLLDNHPNPQVVPTVEYVVGHIYYLMGDLQQSSTTFLRIAERYPKADNADDAYYWYLQSQDDLNVARITMADMYQSYLDRFPTGNHVEIVSRRIIYCRNAR